MKREQIRGAIYFVLTVLAGCGLHFLYDWSPNLLFAILAPVRESVWEHLKLVFWPMLAAALLFSRRERERRAAWYLALLVASALLLLYGWVYNVRMAQANMVVDITAYVLILALGFGVAFWVPVHRRWRSALLLVVGVLAVLLGVFTFYQPSGLLFADLALADALYTLPC
jgi:peptidoglycan/LPS O-acetylase OafA/YrhL